MPRIRTIKPEFWDSPDTIRASLRGRLLYIAMWNWADDYGIGDANLNRLVSFAFPGDDVPASDFPTLASEVSGCFGVIFYEHLGRPYYWLPTWEKHQRTEKKARQHVPFPEDAKPAPDQGRGTSASSVGFSDASRGSTVPGTRGTGEQGELEEQGELGNGDQLTLTVPPTEQPSIDDLFARWWTDYPRKVSKPAARRAFAAALGKVHPDRSTACDDLIAAIREHRRHWLDLEGRPVDKIPHPATWLNAEAWNDELPPDDAYRTRPAAAATETPTERIMRMRTAALAQLNGGESNGNDRRMPRPALGARVS